MCAYISGAMMALARRRRERWNGVKTTREGEREGGRKTRLYDGAREQSKERQGFRKKRKRRPGSPWDDDASRESEEGERNVWADAKRGETIQYSEYARRAKSKERNY